MDIAGADLPSPKGAIPDEDRIHDLATENRRLSALCEQLRKDHDARGETIDHLQRELEVERSRGPLSTTGRRLLGYAAAGLAVPAAAVIGGGAAALDLAAAWLPLRTRFGRTHMETQSRWVLGEDLPPLHAPEPQRSERAATDLPLASLIILTYEGRDLLERYLPSVQAAVARSGQPHEIIVVDNGSTDGTVAMLRQRFPEVRVLAMQRNYYFAAANNAAARIATHDILVFLNNDMQVEPDFLDPLLRPFQERDVFAVSSQIFLTDPRKRRVETGLTRANFQRGMLEFRHDLPPEQLGATLVPVFYGGGGSCAFDRGKFLELGGFDLLYHPFYCEDTDLSLRAWQRGWQVLLAPASKVYHQHRTTTRRVFGDRTIDMWTRSNTLLLHWANLRDPAMLAEHLINLPRVVVRDVDRHGVMGLRSFGRALRHAPKALSRRLRARSEGPSDRDILALTGSWCEIQERSAPRKSLRADQPLRIVMLAPIEFYPVHHGGATRMYHVLRELARRGHRVSVVARASSEEYVQAAEHLREFCQQVRLLVPPKRAIPAQRFRFAPADAVYFDFPELHQALDEVVAQEDADVVQLEYTGLGGYARPSRRRIWCLTEHDVSFVSRYRRALIAKGGLERLQGYAEYLRMFHYELQILRRFDAVFSVTQRDAALLNSYLAGSVFVSGRAPIGVDVARFAALQRQPEPASLLFVGFFPHRPNADAILYFAREILPRIHQRLPQVRLTIIGAEPPAEIWRLSDDPRVTVSGFVEDLAPYYQQATAFVAPIRVGAGVRVKILESFAAGVPVVSTNAGAEGLDVRDGQELLLGDDPESFAQQVVTLLGDAVLQARLTAAARSFVGQHYAWPAIVAALEEEYRAALARKGLLRGEGA